MFVVISYDIQDDRRRARIHKALKSYGLWVQYSVFECKLEKKEYLRLRDRLNRLIDKEAGDSICFYFLCEGCIAQVERIGGVQPLSESAILV
jgi:CRISPR-associated protein Cas2